MDFITPYAYHFENASVIFHSSVSEISVTLGFAFVCIFALVIGPYAYGYFVRSTKEAERIEKHRMLQNLIVMKEVQTELEEEMRRTLTNANLS